MFREPPRAPVQDRGPRINEQIRLSPIRVVGAEGEQLGILPTMQALEKARELGLDLVEVAPTERPPVCRIMDYGKFRFEQSKKAAKSAKSHQQKQKEIRVSPVTGQHDIDVKLNQAHKFLQHHDKVRICVRFRGRQLQHIEEGKKILESMIEKLSDVGKVESPPRMEGKQMAALVAPKSGH
ncbi:MAG: translation initiation factor IF-3 [Planctomycetia bacterium]|nr:translation initiation factor IF-3 [Planctomycetia bacterium]